MWYVIGLGALAACLGVFLFIHRSASVVTVEASEPELPEYMYTRLPDGTVLRSKVIGFHPDFGFPLTSRRWEEVP